MHSVSDTPIEILSITMNIWALNYIRCYGLLYRHIIPQFLPDISEMLVVLFVSTEVINVRHWEYYRFVIILERPIQSSLMRFLITTPKFRLCGSSVAIRIGSNPMLDMIPEKNFIISKLFLL